MRVRQKLSEAKKRPLSHVNVIWLPRGQPPRDRGAQDLPDALPRHGITRPTCTPRSHGQTSAGFPAATCQAPQHRAAVFLNSNMLKIQVL